MVGTKVPESFQAVNGSFGKFLEMGFWVGWKPQAEGLLCERVQAVNVYHPPVVSGVGLRVSDS